MARKRKIQWLSIVALAATIGAALLTRAECSREPLSAGCAAAALRVVATALVGPMPGAPTGSTGKH